MLHVLLLLMLSWAKSAFTLLKGAEARELVSLSLPYTKK